MESFNASGDGRASIGRWRGWLVVLALGVVGCAPPLPPVFDPDPVPTVPAPPLPPPLPPAAPTPAATPPAATPPGSPPPTAARPCTLYVTAGSARGVGSAESPFGTLTEAEAAAGPGSVICVAAGDFGAERLVVDQSGRQDAPIVMRAVGSVTTAGFDVAANWWSIEGFTVAARSAEPTPGISVRGTGVSLLRNSVVGATAYGIRCDNAAPACDRGVISGNVVTGAVGTGIFVYGADILVEGNDVSGSIQVGDSDADGIRFFGDRLRLVGNHIHDISAAGWPAGQEPHADCFQTFSVSKRPVVDVVIENNTCDAVADQCLIASGEGASSRLTFVNNICRNSGSQAIYIENVQDVFVANNLFLPTIRFTGVFLASGASGVTIVNNVFVGAIDPYNTDESPAPAADYNLAVVPGAGAPGYWSEPHGVSGVLPGYLPQLADLRSNVSIAPDDPTVDAGTTASVAKTDRFGRPRPTDGNGDGVSAFDIGPFER